MIPFILNFLSPPTFEDVEETRIARLLNYFVVGLLVASFFGTVLPALTITDPAERNLTLLIGLILVSALFGLKWVLNRGQLRVVGVLTSLVFFLAATATISLFGGLRTANTATYILVIVLITLSARQEVRIVQGFTAAAILVTLVIFYAELNGLIIPKAETEITDWLVYSILFIIVGLLVRFAITSLNQAVERAERSERELEESNKRLQSLNETLEARVVERTRVLEISADISQRLSTILDRQELIAEVVNSLRRAFGYYYVHIFLFDSKKQVLYTAGGTGETGRILRQQGFHLQLSQGLVGQAATTRRPVLVPNVSTNVHWLSNPHLPETQAEIAIPILRGDQVLGVLDVQQNQISGLNQQDVDMLQLVAGQVAIALQNAELYAQAQGRAKREAIINQINQQIQQTTDIDSALQIAVRELGRALRTPRTQVRLIPLGWQPTNENGHE